MTPPKPPSPSVAPSGRPGLPLASDNERMILDIVRRHEPITRAAMTERTNLTQQSVHRLVEGLIERNLLRAGAPLKGGRGQPSPTIELVGEAVCSLGISINTDSAVLCLADFGCNVIEEIQLRMVPERREATLQVLSGELSAMLVRHGIARSRLLGLGFSMSGFFISGNREFNAPEPLRDWSLIDLRPDLERIFQMPVWLENNATTGAIGESLRGAGLSYPSFAYLSFNYGFGGGVIIDGKPHLGVHGNAGEFSGIYSDEESSRRPALQYLIRDLQDNGVDIHAIEDLRTRFDPSWPGVEAWLEKTMPSVDRLIATLIAVLDPQAIVFGGQLPAELGRMMIARARKSSEKVHRYDVGPPVAELVLSQTKGDAAVLGAALLPLKLSYFL
ncbi:NagC family transcriptional regulator [Pararhizobium polonicum]|uniref:NagC family transcriptional regulator n=1 Tax=Pararhizobium polonicum TaxID=1612624 RepID=A0A1C7P505_9HYPH|nr:ROK family transcriptional regulator [Pararhizobium polonicum]OBZ94794.1 NagC family transcriptional regulator [Pararhizobium polonicum]